MPITEQARAILNNAANAIVDTVHETKTLGAPACAIYLDLMTQGCFFSQFTSLMGVLVIRKRLVQAGNLYFTPSFVAPKNSENFTS